ncbi:hypothetical protein ACFLU5_01555 [Bacteroidota bacterium]
MNQLNTNPKDREPIKTRRTFIQSMGMFIGGLSLPKSFLLFGNRRIGTEKESLILHSGINEIAQDAVKLPQGVKAVWDVAKAYHESTPTREQICINGLWMWQPGEFDANTPPTTNWGYFKVPGNWPGFNDYMQRENQRVFEHPDWDEKLLDDVKTAWYQREISIPKEWAGRRYTLSLRYLNSLADVYMDGKLVGQMFFPSGKLDITSQCKPGNHHILTIKVTALPLQDVVVMVNDSNAPRLGEGRVQRRGLCGDVYLKSTPTGARIENVKIDTFFRNEEIMFNASIKGIDASKQYNLHVVITDKGSKVKEFTSKSFSVKDLKDDALVITEKWNPQKLWDIHTPQNKYNAIVMLVGGSKKVLDTSLPVTFGFRELWIDGRDFYLNGTRIFLSAVPLDNAQGGASLANYEAAKESLLRLQSFGINFVYTHNYGCEPGTHLSFVEVLRAADDVGMLVSFSQPHYRHYEWEDPDADQNNGYANHARFYVREAQNHPSVVFYSMNHNYTGYAEDMNPDKIDGYSNPRSPAALRNAKRAQRVEAIVHKIDPNKIIYHHSSGNLSSMHTSNFYPNWVPIQEMCDWFGHWSTTGVKPLFTCEFGSPFPWDWAVYRGWYKGKREFGRAQVPWEFCLAEWNAQFLGDTAYQISDMEKENLRWEAEQFQAGKVWGRSDYPYNMNSTQLKERFPVYAMHKKEHWRAFRTWEMSANSPWIFSMYWILRDGVDKSPKEFKIDWENLQRPGLSPDFIKRYRERMDMAFERSDWIPTITAEALINNNKPLLAYIGGKKDAFTSKDHIFLPGETLEKQIIIINNCRENISCECRWSLNLPQAVTGIKSANIATGHQERIPVSFNLPADLKPGRYELNASVEFSNGEIQKDTFFIYVLLQPSAVNPPKKIALWDPKGETGKLIDDLEIFYQNVNANADLSGYDLLIIGKEALTVDGPGLDLTNVRKGLKVIVFEQTSDILQNRFGFRIQEYGLRHVYRRINDHPVLSGLDEENLRDWRGEATLLPSQLNLEISEQYRSPSTKWCDMEVTRIWRCGNRGNVASVLIEKPARGNFLPLTDGGYSLQYSPLMEYREGKGVVLFCQMDVSGRTETDPAAQKLTRNIISYVSGFKPAPNREALYIGDTSGKSHLEKAAISAGSYNGGKLSSSQVLILGPGSGKQLSAHTGDISKWLKKGGHLMAVGLNQEDGRILFPGITIKENEHIASYFESLGITSLLPGIGSADVHNRAPKEIPLVSSGAEIVGNGVLATAKDANAVFCQMVPWHCDYSNEQHNIKQTYRRSSFLLNRLLGNMGVASSTQVLARFNSPVDEGENEKRWLDDLYMDEPEEWDDPYRFFRW